MKAATSVAIALAMLGASGPPEIGAAAARSEAVQTQGGIPLDAPWKKKIYSFAREKLKHPAWGWSHSERDYLLAMQIAEREGMPIDADILFAAAFTHDIGAIGEFQKEGVDHAARSVELAEPLLREAGFPIEKWDAVKAAILGHMHDKPAGNSNEGIVLHDADTLDFLGSVGIARRLAVTGTADDYAGRVARIRDFAQRLPGRLVTSTAKSMSEKRAAEMHAFLNRLDAETFGGRLP